MKLSLQPPSSNTNCYPSPPTRPESLNCRGSKRKGGKKIQLCVDAHWTESRWSCGRGEGGWQGVRRLDKDVFRDLPVTGSSHDIPKCFLPLHPSVLEFLRRITADPAIPYPSSAYFHPSADGRTECNHASSAMIYAFCRAGITLRVHARPRDLPLRMYRCIYPMFAYRLFHKYVSI